MTETFVPPDHPMVEINYHRVGGKPCIAGTRLPTRMIADYLKERIDSGQPVQAATAYEWVRLTWGCHVTDEMIDAAVAFEADPDHDRITRNAIRRQRYAEAKAAA